MTLLPEVRAAIVKAVPEIQGHCLRHARTTKNCEFCAAYFRPIRLADVLRAIQKKTDGKLPRDESFFKLFEKQAYSWDTIYAYFCVGGWNLAVDSLDDQSEDTIVFLHSVLCADKKV